MKKVIFDIQTKEAIETELTNEDIAEIEALELEKEAEAAKQAKLESARTKLAALGLDEDEIAAIVGI